MKTNGIMEVAISGTSLQITVRDVPGTLVFDTTLASPECAAIAVMHGWKQRIADAAAIARDTKTGASATPEEKHEAMRALIEHYESGTTEWSRVASAGPKGGILFKALCRMYADQTPKQVREFLDGISKREQAALRAVPNVKAVIEAIEAEDVEAGPKVDTAALLAKLGA